MNTKPPTFTALAAVTAAIALASPWAAAEPKQGATPPDRSAIKDIKAYCIDFNWAPTQRRGRPFAGGRCRDRRAPPRDAG